MRERKRDRSRLIAGINITPFTDVVLVLLIIFMIATPLLIRSEIKVNLPRAVAADIAAQRSVVVTIDSRGNLFVDGAGVALAQLSSTLSGILARRPNSPVIVMGDRDVRYDLVVRVLEIARTNGVSRLSLAVQGKQ